jgi:hypothetical protein
MASMDRIFHGQHSGYIPFVAVALFLAVSSCFAEVFIDESESAPSEYAREKWGLKATKITRPIMVVIFLLMASFGIWKIYQP